MAAKKSAPDTKRPVGRPSLCTPEVTGAICRRLMLGESLASITSDEAMPAEDTVYGWLFEAWGAAPKPEHVEFSERYARARAVQQERAGDQAKQIAEDVPADRDQVARAKLRVEVLKWVAERMSPKRYGAKTTTELTGKDGGPIETRQSIDTSKLSTETLRRIQKEAGE